MNESAKNEKKSIEKPISIEDKIIRETKIVKFEDINEIEEETTYLIEIDKNIDIKRKNLLEIPFDYFRIPEEQRSVKLLNLMDINSEDLSEKIIWYYIFEVIYGNKKAKIDWNNFKQNLKEDLRKKDVLKRSKKQNNWKEKDILSKDIIEQIKKIKIRNFIEEESNFEEILNYPNKKRKSLVNHLTDPYWESKIFFLLFIILGSLFLIFSLINFSIFTFITSLIFFIPFLILFILFFQARNKLIKRGELNDKLKQTIRILIPKFNKYNKKEKNDKLKYLDKQSEDLYRFIYNITYFELEKAIINYKSFNPILLKIFINNKEIFPEKTSNKGFFHKTTIALNFNKKPKSEYYPIKIITKRIIRKTEKTKKIVQKVPQSLNLKSPLLTTLFILMFISVISSLFIPIMLLVALVLFGLFYLIIFLRFEWHYIYYSPLQTQYKEVLQTLKLYYFNFFRNNKKTIYSIPFTLKKDCSYYWLIYAPRFHKIKIVPELKNIMNKLEKPLAVRTTYDISQDIVSFHIPRSINIDKIDFDLDLEIPLKSRISGWYYGIIGLLFIMIFSFIYYLFSLFFHSPSINFTIFGLVLTFLVLFMGIFGREFLGNPTKDLYKKSSFLIILTILVGILFSISFAFTFIFKPFS